MFTQLLAYALQAVIAAGMLFQVVTLARYAAAVARSRRAARVAERTAVRRPVPAQRPRVSRVRRRDYRLALRAARASVSA